MKRDQVISTIKKAREDPSHFLELVQQHVSMIWRCQVYVTASTPYILDVIWTVATYWEVGILLGCNWWARKGLVFGGLRCSHMVFTPTISGWRTVLPLLNNLAWPDPTLKEDLVHCLLQLCWVQSVHRQWTSTCLPLLFFDQRFHTTKDNLIPRHPLLLVFWFSLGLRSQASWHVAWL